MSGSDHVAARREGGREGGRDGRTYRKIMFSTGAGRPGTFQGILAFQQRQASDRCCMMVRA